VPERAERLVSHCRPEVRAADADVDDASDSLAGVTPPSAGADLLSKGRHAVQLCMDERDDVGAVDEDAVVPG